MKLNRTTRQTFPVFLVLAICCFLIPQTALGQTETLGIVKYASPAGMNKTPKENVVAFSEFNQTTGKYCIITLYGATPGTGNAQSDFAREWNNLVVKVFAKAPANPETGTESADGWTAIGGGAEVEGELGKAVAFLTVISGYARTVSILGVFNDAGYTARVDSFITSIEMDKPAAPVNNTAVGQGPTFDSAGKLIIPILRRDLTLADLAGEWRDSERIATAYINSNTGKSAGTDSLSYKTKMTITGNGGYTIDFFQIRNREKLSDLEVGTISVNGRLVTKRPKEYGVTRWVVIGWLELPDMTLMTVSSTYFAGNVIPESVFTSNDHREYSTIWVRKK